MTTRRTVAALALAAVLVTSGCVGFLTGGESLTFEAEPVQVSDSARQDAGYEQERRTTQTINRTFTAAGQERDVSVTNHLSEYSRSADTVLSDQQVARMIVLSTPQVKVAGQGPFNPVGELSNRELVSRVTQKYDSIQNVRFESNRTLTMLGEETTVSKFRADATLQGGQEVEVFLHITKIQHEGDFVVAVAVHPTQIDEQERVDTLFRGVDHPAPAPES
ncbi:DUF6517 family protein [Halosegnis sp.]|uniref:DUF6517 family protein n=1 Tax=Halosegnis sp. TaxID=2864959 RepID=UPI0035D4F714